MNIMTEPLHQTDKPLPQGLHVRPSYSTYNCGSRRTTVQLYNIKDHAIIIKKGTAVARMVATNEVPEMVVADGAVEALQTQRWAKVMSNSSSRRKILFKKLGDFWSQILDRREQRGLLTEYHDIFTLEDGEMGSTEAAEHKIEVTDPKPFKERPRNIPSGLLEDMKDHLDHMLNVGAIKPSKSSWSNAVVLVQKKDGGLTFCIDFQRLNTRTRKDAFPLPQIHDAIDALSGSKYYTTVDLLSRFWQTPMEKSSTQYTAFTVGTLGFF